MASDTETTFRQALSTLLIELFDGPAADSAYVLNPGDPGLLTQLESIGAAAASAPPGPGRPTVAAHVDHVHFGLQLLNRWAAGEANPWAGADWNASWRRTVVTDDEWLALRDRLREAAAAWRRFVEAREEWDELAAAGALASAVHAGYHLGAIRQILLSLER